jgi:hypothetical protein
LLSQLKIKKAATAVVLTTVAAFMLRTKELPQDNSLFSKPVCCKQQQSKPKKTALFYLTR